MVDSPASTSSQHGAQHQRIMSTGTPSAGALSPTGPSSEGQFNIDAFDFSAEFALPTGLDELNIFAGATSVAEAHQQGSSSGASGSVGAPSPAAGSANNAGGGGGSAGFSPAGSMRGERSSRHGSPRAQMGSLNGSTTPGANGMSAGASSPLAQLLMNMGENGNVQAALGILRSNQQQQQQQQQQNHDATGQRQMSINDLQRILVEKEQAERLQNMQTAVLRQQLEALQRQTGAQLHQHQQQQGQQQHHNQQQQAHHHHQQQQHHQQHHQEDQQMLSSHHLAHLEHQQQQQQMGGSGTPTQQHPGPSNGYPYPASQPYSQPHEAPHGLRLQMPSSYSQQQQQQQQQQPLQSPGIPSPCDPTSSAMAQYGLMTPMNSGAFNSNAQASVQAFANNTFSPLESPAITPASVFSNAPTATSSADFFSPLTSPALRPQPPSAGEMMLPPAQSPRGVRSSSGAGSGANGSASGSGTKRGGGVAAGAVSPAFGPQYHSTTPTASPLALMGHAKPGPLPRKNRSTTAEARANKMRPSPLVKPTAPPSRGRTRGNSIAAAAAAAAASATATPTTALAGSAPGSRRPSVSEGSASGGVSRSNSQQRTPSYSVSAFTPLAGTSKSLDASPSEGAASTPSPIDLSASSMPPPAAPATGKPLTPGSIMGIGASSKKANGTTAASKGKTKATSNGSASVTFADSPTNGVVEHPRFEPDWITASATHMKQSGGGPDSRRTSHKAAEQKRRDSLKYCFDELRGMLPAITLDDAAPGGSYLGPDGRLEDIEAEQFNPAEVCDAETARLANRAISKVALLRHSNEYLIRISNRLARRDAALAEARAEIVQLRAALGLPTPQPMMHHHQNHHLINDHHMMAMHDDSGGQMDVS